MDKKEIWKIVIKVAIYALTLVGAALGISAMNSCSTSRDVTVKGKAVIVTNDTTIIDHGRVFNYNYTYKR